MLQPAFALLRLAGERGVVAGGGCVALLLLDTDVHGGFAACAWRGDADALRAAARAAQIPFDDEGRLLLPGRGRARDFDLLIDATRRQAQHGDALPSEVVMSSAGGRQRETPRVPYSIVGRDGVVLALPSPDGERNLFDTLEATGVLDVEAARRPCLRLAVGRISDRFRATASALLDTAIETLMPIDRQHFDLSFWRARSRAAVVAQGLLDALCSVDEIFVQREAALWRAYLRMRPGTFGATLLDVAVNGPVAELLADLPDGSDWIAGRLDPDALQAVPDDWERGRTNVLSRMHSRRSPSVWSSRFDDELKREQESATAFLTSISGRFWMAGSIDASRADRKSDDDAVDADAIGSTRLALFFEKRPDAEPVGLLTTLVDTLVPRAWRDAIRIGSALVYRPSPQRRGLLEVVAKEPDRVVKETVAAMKRGGVAPPAAAPAEAFLALRMRSGALGPVAGDLYATREALGIALRFVPAAP